MFSGQSGSWRAARNPPYLQADLHLLCFASLVASSFLSAASKGDPMKEHTALKSGKNWTRGYASKASTLGGIRSGIMKEEGPGILTARATKEVTESIPTSKALDEDSLIEMTGPKRGIALYWDVLFEFDMRIKNGEREEDDLQLIVGETEFLEMQMPWTPFTVRFNGEYGAVDMCLVNVFNGVEATVELIVSEVQNGFDLSISAVLLDTELRLKFKADQKGSNVAEYCCSFEAKLHGSTSHQIKLELASILVKDSMVHSNNNGNITSPLSYNAIREHN
ncbi:hypothetical protein EJB05_05907, partial [Eragrostis curvula]